MELTLVDIVKAGITIVGCAGFTIFLWKRTTYKQSNPVAAYKYMIINVISNTTECDNFLSNLRSKCQTYNAVGFDCEWVTEHGKRQPVALLQLSSSDGLCGLFRLNLLKSVPKSLKEFLEDETIFKVGVGPLDDAKYLDQDYSVALKSTLDLRHLVQIFGYHPGGLASLSKSLLGVMLDKDWRVRCSDWEAENLTERQVKYAAVDAHVAIKIFEKLIKQSQNHSLVSWFYRKRNTNYSNWNNLCIEFADLHFKGSKQQNETKLVKSFKESNRPKDQYPHATRSKPLYHNCFLQAPDGELLCTCDNRKAQWYVDKELADVVSATPFTVRLRFEPAGRSVGDVGRYYQLLKENKCVVCGSDESYIRKNVIPREYRKYFPEIMKEHSSHDVVLLCVRCHKRSNMLDHSLRLSLSMLCDAPLSSLGTNSRLAEDADVKKVRSAARALVYQAQKLPKDRRSQLEAVLLQHYPGRELTDDLLREAADLQVVYENADYESHGNKVVEYFLRHDGLLKLEEKWRQHFLETSRPRFMPPLWSVKHNEERIRVRFDEGRLTEEDLIMLGLSNWL